MGREHRLAGTFISIQMCTSIVRKWIYRVVFENGSPLRSICMMTSKERLMTALNRGKPDRLPVTIHQWQDYHLEKYMGGTSALEACKKMGLDAQKQYFEEMVQFWVANADFEKFNTRVWKDIPHVVCAGPQIEFEAPGSKIC